MASIQPRALGKLNGLMLTAMMVSSFLYIRNGEMLHPTVILINKKLINVSFCDILLQCVVGISQINEGEKVHVNSGCCSYWQQIVHTSRLQIGEFCHVIHFYLYIIQAVAFLEEK